MDVAFRNNPLVRDLRTASAAFRAFGIESAGTFFERAANVTEGTTRGFIMETTDTLRAVVDPQTYRNMGQQAYRGLDWIRRNPVAATLLALNGRETLVNAVVQQGQAEAQAQRAEYQRIERTQGQAAADIYLGEQVGRRTNQVVSVALPGAQGVRGLVLAGRGERVIAGLAAAERGAGSGVPKFTFRGDSRLESEIFRDGFAPRGTSTDLMAHALDNTLPPSAFVSSSRSFNVASGFGDNVYVLRPTNGIDVNRALGAGSPFPLEQEIAIFGRVAPSNIRAVTRPSQGVSILNPGYKPQ